MRNDLLTPEFLANVKLGINEDLREYNYLVFGDLNIVTNISFEGEVYKGSVTNTMMGINKKKQIIELPSDPAYITNISSTEDAAKLSVHYALMCLMGIDLSPLGKVNIITSHKNAYSDLIRIFNMVKNSRLTYQELMNIRSQMHNGIEICILDALIELNRNINLLFVKKEKENLNHSIAIFNEVNLGFPSPTIHDMIQFQSSLYFGSHIVSSYCKNLSDKVSVFTAMNSIS